MKILQISPCMDATPPHVYGPPEQVASDLTEELVHMGHDITLFATGDSHTSGRLVYKHPKAPERFDVHYNTSHLEAAFSFAASQNFDFVHNHASSRGVEYCLHLSVPHITTMCWLGNQDLRNTLRNLTHLQLQRSQFVAVSNKQRQVASDFNWAGTVYNGINVSSFPFQVRKAPFLLFLGRVLPEKGVDIAVQVARQSGMPLVLAGIFQSESQPYFDTFIKPYVDGNHIQWLGPADQTRKRELLSQAAAVLVPSRWEEPFGLIMVEALACGTPVLTFRRGAAPEIIQHEQTGFIVDTVDEMIQCISHLDTIAPHACRNDAEKRFSSQMMAESYLKIYQKTIAEWKE
jgi:glycosyltransferase involved in cell wall biosynthesis